MSHIIAKKQEEWNSEKVRELLRLPENKKCFDCPTKSPFFVNISIQTFICTRCSGLVREVGHRVKSISASKFSGPEIVALQHGGNEVARTIWLSNYRIDTPEPETDGDIRLFMRQKYYEQKWLDRKKGVLHAENVKRIITELYTPEGNRKSNTAMGRSGSMDKRKSLDIRPKIVQTQSWVDDNVPIGLIPAVQHNKNAMDDLLLNNDMMLSPKSPKLPSSPIHSQTFISRPPFVSGSPVKQSPMNQPFMSPPPSMSQSYTSSPPPFMSPPPLFNNQDGTSNSKNITKSSTNDIFTELAGLSTYTPIASPTYSGGILQPNSPISPSVTSSQSQQKPNVLKEDPYAALRDLSIGSKPVVTTPTTNTLKIKTSSDDVMTWGDFQKSPTKTSFNKPMFSDLDPLFKR